MCSGHYTAYICSHGKWYCYDDAHSYEVAREDIPVGNAYMLFYIRKFVPQLLNVTRDATGIDITRPGGLDRVMPRLEEPFVGKPVATRLGYSGYIKEIREDQHCRYVVKCFESNVVLYLRFGSDKRKRFTIAGRRSYGSRSRSA